MPVEKPIFGHFREILPFSTGNKSVTTTIYQSNSTTVVWRMYRGKGFVLDVIGIEALLPTYSQLKTHFLPLWLFGVQPLCYHWLAIGTPMATHLHPSGHHSRLSGSIEKGLYYYFLFLQNYLCTFHALDDTFVGLIFVEGFTVGLKC